MMVATHREANQSIFADILQELQGRVRNKIKKYVFTYRLYSHIMVQCTDQVSEHSWYCS
jgi:hypothetical protein